MLKGKSKPQRDKKHDLKQSYPNKFCECCRRICKIEQSIQTINKLIQNIVKALAQPSSKNILNSKKKSINIEHKILNQTSLKKIDSYKSSSRQIQRQEQKISFDQHQQSQSESLLLQDLQFISKKNITINEDLCMMNVGLQISNLKTAIKQIQKQIEILPKLKSNFSMLTKIVEYIDEKTQNISYQLANQNAQKMKPVRNLSKKQQNISLESLCFSDESNIKEIQVKNKNIQYKKL